MKLRRRRRTKTNIACSSITQLGRSQSYHSRSILPPPFIISILSPSTQPTSPHRPAPACRPPRIGRAIFFSYPSPSCPASPFLLHKITEAEECGGCHVAEHPASRSNYSVRAPSSPAGPSPSGTTLVLHHLRFFPSLGAVHPHRAEP